MTQLTIARFRNKQDNRAVEQSGDWAALCQRLTRHVEREEKDGPLWSPTEYGEKKVRGTANVAAVSALVLDFDGGVSPAEFTRGWNGHAYAMHTTFGHTEEHPKWRVVFPFTKPVPAAEWPSLWPRLAKHFGGNAADAQCKDASRIYYLPACPPGATPAAHEQQGEWINPDEFRRPGVDLLISKAREYLHEGRHAAGVRLGNQMRDNGYTQTETERANWHNEVEREKLNANGTVDIYDEAEWLATVRWVFSRPPRDPWPATTAVNYTPLVPLVVSVKPYTKPEAPIGLEPEAYYGLAGEVVNTISPHTESSDAAILASFLVSTGVLFGRAPYVYRDGTHHCANEFACLVGLTAKGRKGTATRRTDEIMRMVDIQYFKYNKLTTCTEEGSPLNASLWSKRIIRGLGSGEALIAALSEADEDLDPDTGVRRRLVFEEEFARPLKVMRREGSILSEIIRATWDGSPLSSRTKGKLLEARGGHLSLLAHITDAELREQLQSSEMFNGFANRILWICTQRSKSLPMGGGRPPLERVANSLKRALDHAAETHQMDFDDEARSIWCEGGVYDLLIDRPTGLLGSVTGRAEAHVTRLAMLYALLDCMRKIKAPHLLAALAVWDYSERSAAHIFGRSMGDHYADVIDELLSEAAPGFLTRTEIRNYFHRNAPPGAIPKALSLLEELGFATRSTLPTGGKPSEVWSSHTLNAYDQRDQRSPLVVARRH